MLGFGFIIDYSDFITSLKCLVHMYWTYPPTNSRYRTNKRNFFYITRSMLVCTVFILWLTNSDSNVATLVQTTQNCSTDKIKRNITLGLEKNGIYHYNQSTNNITICKNRKIGNLVLYRARKNISNYINWVSWLRGKI